MVGARLFTCQSLADPAPHVARAMPPSSGHGRGPMGRSRRAKSGGGVLGIDVKNVQIKIKNVKNVTKIKKNVCKRNKNVTSS